MNKDPKTVQEMFGKIAGRYDFMNTLMTMGQDQSWRRFVLKTANPPQNGSLLDVACGTGPMALMAAAMYPSVKITAVDFTENMVRVALGRPGCEKISWGIADGLALPFPDASFDAVTSGYLIRNVPDPLKAFQEQTRVLKPGGKVVCLDTCPPPDSIFKPAIMVHMKYVIPLLGQVVAKNRSAYEYLPDTTANFMNPRQLISLMKQAGLKNIGFRQFMFNTQTVAWGTK
ncbi:MAG: ubiquinone/menaquinone biosynthesis methyltransferase [Desulfatibacillum sp.]|nr:ubiquinone/menaquinone biosynthesis methyltransferase [Desulfatibacillum sp.]